MWLVLTHTKINSPSNELTLSSSTANGKGLWYSCPSAGRASPRLRNESQKAWSARGALLPDPFCPNAAGGGMAKPTSGESRVTLTSFEEED